MWTKHFPDHDGKKPFLSGDSLLDRVSLSLKKSFLVGEGYFHYKIQNGNRN